MISKIGHNCWERRAGTHRDTQPADCDVYFFQFQNLLLISEKLIYKVLAETYFKLSIFRKKLY